MAALITIPALVEVNIGTDDAPIIVPTAFYAVVSIGVIGLYTAFAIPIYLRWRAGDTFKQGKWNLGTKWKWMAPVAVIEILIISVYFILPFTPAANPFNEDFEWKFVNYAPILTRRRAAGPVDRLAPVGQEVVHRAEDDDRPARGRHRRGRDRHGAPRQDRPRRRGARLEAGRPAQLSGVTVTDLEQLLDGIPVLTGQGRHVTPLPGGLTNTNYRVRTDDGLDVVVRVSSPETGLLGVDRALRARQHPGRRGGRASAPRSSTTSRAAACMVVGFLPGRTWVDADVAANLAAAGRRAAPAARRAGLRRPVRHVRAASRATSRSCASAGSGCRRATSTLEPFAERVEAVLRPGTRSRSCRATTTCSPPTSSTTAATCGSSTTSTPA